ncbi:MOSC domain-containing protein [Geodermatophilus sp. URMC 61]|uniref:MOSC domain-containing protein n=1 Tax=Geodermatophilus sp. URMC 61 TaxID=3423411 RepID=UPI00406CF94E
MIDVDLPPGPHAGALARGFAACLASVTEVPVTDLPLPDADLAHALGAWRTWLAEHGSGLVPIADPVRFQWAGWWIAVVEDPPGPAGGRPAGQTAVAVLAFGTPPGVVLSPQAPALLGRATADLRIREAYAVASLDPVLHRRPTAPDLRGTVAGLAVAPAAEAPMRLLEVAHARAGRGLDGDRYAAGAGTFSPRAGRRPGYDLTLIAAEVLDELAAAGQVLDFAGTRRNVLTRGLDVDALVGRRFRIGEVLCDGRRPCEPCVHLDRLSGPGILRPLIHRGGLRADVLTDGEIRLGAPILSV